MGPMVHLTVKTVHTGTSLPVAAPNGSSVLEIIQRAGAGEADLYTLVGSDGRSLGSHDRITMPATMHLILRPVAPVSLPSNTVATRTEESDRMRTFGELGTLYARCGGIMGIASFADRCMDKWMADPTLNANTRVLSWHARSQRCGAATYSRLRRPSFRPSLLHTTPATPSAILLTYFSLLAAGFKFLVTQLMGYLTGGPQRYAPRPAPPPPFVGPKCPKPLANLSPLQVHGQVHGPVAQAPRHHRARVGRLHGRLLLGHGGVRPAHLRRGGPAGGAALHARRLHFRGDRRRRSPRRIHDDRYDGLLLVFLCPSVRATRRCLPDRPLRGPPHRRAARRSARGHPRGRAKA